MTGARSAQSGISLMETLIALFVVALLATAGGIMLTQTLRGTRLLEERGTAATRLQSAMSILRDDFSSFVDRASRTDGTSELPSRFYGQPVRSADRVVTFVRNSWSNPGDLPRSDLQRLEYRFEDGALIRRSWSAPDTAPGTIVSDQVLLTGLDEMSVRYGRERTWKTDWIVAAGSTETEFPDKVEFVFTFAEDDTMRAVFRLGGTE
ncbi:type II secretion system minor pseudopilin GspJ [Hyphomonas sp.]|uniref:type II secretion system minor pseudopilin GspJ n=1 Tax=Hyphomonas sp. TaxID=87 RepID=UPI001BCEE942|nr:type II secretion system minor pseudopilin GspJ [Hyphomonas sp.]